jgi:uncharacterized protein YdeI (YjbR/CyaY-like superfamily)
MNAAVEHPEPTYFRSADALRRWFAKHASNKTELIAGFMKVGSGVPSITWPQSVDEALCVGWIDGRRTGIDEHRYMIRFTPRKRSSHWSAVNIRRVGELIAEGRMQPAGLLAFSHRTEERSVRASYEQPGMPELPPVFKAVFKRQKKAWAFFEAQPPGYRKKLVWWVISAKQELTREKRLATLMAACAEGKRIL